MVIINIDLILKFFEKNLVFSDRQYEWDNSGKQVYLGNCDIHKIGFALDPSLNVINQAIEEGCELLITHHPLFFSQVKSINSSTKIGEKTVKAIQGNLNIVSYHTSLDLADYSLNDYIASLLNAEVLSTFIEEGKENFFKFVVLVPCGHEEVIRNVMGDAGAGHIGNYSKCSFTSKGIGRFLPSENTQPFIGSVGELEKVEESRIETIISEKKLEQLTKDIIDVHPYEEVPYDIYPLALSKPYGLGRICKLDDSITLEVLIKIICEKLGCTSLRHNSEDLNLKISSFAIITGSGASLWKECISKGIKVLLTGDMKHHDALDAAENGVVIIDIGHFETEQIFMIHLAHIIKEKFKLETIVLEEKNSIKYWGL